VSPGPALASAAMDSELLSLDTRSRHFYDLTPDVEEFCSGRADGLCHVFVRHATAGLAIIELGAGSDHDLTETLARLLPRDDRWVHRHGSPGHGADHVLPAFLTPFATLPVLDGRPALGTWQHVVLVDLNDDNPRRNVRLSFLAG
jgi:secondary thiamine-phosphate synthase enzyme